MDSNRVAWLAGLVDADGCIGMYSSGGNGFKAQGRGSRIVPKVTITTTCRKTRDRVQEIFKELGVGLHIISRNPPPETGWADRWDLEAAGMKRVNSLLPYLLPHLVTKHMEATLTLQFIASRFASPIQKKPYTSEEVDLIRRVRALKRNRNNS